MYKLVIFCGFIVIAAAASLGREEVNGTTTTKRPIIPVLRFESDKQPDGSFRFEYEGGDKTFREETGVIQNAGTDDEALEVSGSYRYLDANGDLVEVHYTAGRNGFVPVGTHILPKISETARAAADLPKISEHDHDKEKKSKDESHSKAADEKRNAKA